MAGAKVDQRNRTENSEVDLYIYGQLIFYKSTRQFSSGKIDFSTNALKHLDIQIYMHKMMNINPYLIPHTNLYSKLVVSLNVKLKSIKTFVRKHKIKPLWP